MFPAISPHVKTLAADVFSVWKKCNLNMPGQRGIEREEQRKKERETERQRQRGRGRCRQRERPVILERESY